MQKRTNQIHKSRTVLCIDLLNTFTEIELKKLQKFVESSYHNTNKKLVLILSFLIKRIINKTEFDDEHQINVYNKIFPNKIKPVTYTSIERRRLFEKIRKLRRLAEKFLVFEALMENKGVFNNFLLTKLNQKDQKALLLRNFRKIEKEKSKHSIKNLEYYELKWNTEIHKLQFLGDDTNSLEQIETGLNQLDYYADIIYVLKKTTLYLNLLSPDKLKLYSEFINMELILNLAKQEKYYANLQVKANLLTIQLFKTKNDKYYTLLLNLVQNYQTDFSREEIMAFYTVLQNYCVQQYRNGINTQEKLVNLYKLADSQNLMLKNGHMPVSKMKSIIVAASKTTNFKWASSFLKKYRPFIKKEVCKSAFYLNLGIIVFYQKNYEKALNCFLKVEAVNLDYDKNCRILILKCHFELDTEFDDRTLRIFRSAEKYFKGLKLFNKNQKKMFANFMNIFINLYKIKHSAARTSLATIEQKLKDQTINSDKQWLLDKIEELKK